MHGQTLSERAFAAEKKLIGIRLAVIALNTLIYLFTAKKLETIAPLAYALIGVAWVYGLYIYLAEPHRRYPILLSSYFTSVTDATLIVLWLFATGGIDSPFYLTFYLSIVAISFRYSSKEILFGCALYLVAYLILFAVGGNFTLHLTELIVRLAYIPMAAALGAVISRELHEQTAAKISLQIQLGADERIKQSEIRVAEAQQLADMGNWEWNLASGELTWSDQLYRIYGVPKQPPVTFDSFLERVHPEERDLVRRMLDRARRGLQLFSFEHRIVRENGEVRTVSCRGQVLSDENNRPLKLAGTQQDVTEWKRAEERLHHLASHDHLTDLPNRNLLTDRITQSLARPPWHSRSVGVLFVDLDRFKLINDSLGHNNGDDLLKAISDRLRGCVRDGDTVARLGGDEFVVLLADIAQQEDAGVVAQKILSRLSEPINLEKHELFVTASIGVAVFPEDGTDAESLLKNAAVAMSRAKEQGRNAYQLYSPAMNSKSLKRLSLETSLRRALEREEFLLYYQPIIDLTTNDIVGTEALLRWKHPEMGLVAPGEFIPLAEETGLIVPIGKWALQSACAQNKRWQESGIPSIPVAVNLSARQFHERGMVDMVRRVLQSVGLDASWLELELTESIMMSNAEAGITTLVALHEMGVRIALDDFGTGYSSLSYLKRFPISALKIDQAFIRNIATDANDRAIASAIVTLGHSFRLPVIAEAVETVEQLELVRQLGCDQVQGYFFSRPLPVEQATELLIAGKIPRLSKAG